MNKSSPRITKTTYNLTNWQWVKLIFLFPVWFVLPPSRKKTWHQLKKGMEKHVHVFTEPAMHKGVPIWKCEHEGCNECNLVKSKKHFRSRGFVREMNRRLKQGNTKQIISNN